MRQRIIILLLTAFACILAGCSQKTVVLEDVVLYGYEPTEEAEVLVENEELELHFIPDTAQFYVVDKATGNKWYSNPEKASDDVLADTVSKQSLQSQIILQYSNNAGNKVTLNSFAYSVEKGLYTYERTENGIKVMYTIGNIERTYCIPLAVPESRMKEFTEQMDKSSIRKIEQYYRKYNLERLLVTDDKEALIEQYPDLTTEPVFVLRDTIQTYLKIQLEELFASVGYTQEDYEVDLQRYNHEITTEKPTYNVSIEYALDGGDFLVSVPYEEIRYKADYPIVQLKVLPYFGAGSTEDEGYLFVPDGSGALIHFNNGKHSQNAYYNSIYGWDIGQEREDLVNDNKASYPVFGIQKNGSSFICVLEDGAAYANIEADVSRRMNSYNYVYPQYIMIHSETMDISSKSDKTVLMFESELPKETITQRYIFCDEPTYTDMAVTYRNYLLSRYDNMKKIVDSEIETTVEILGAADKVQKTLGFPHDAPLPLTTYQEATDMVKDLNGLGWNQLNIKYVGWFNDSIKHDVPTDVELTSKLGNKKDFMNLVKTISELKNELYLEGEFTFVMENGLFDDFSIYSDVARFVNRERIEMYPYDTVWFGQQTYNENLLSYLATPEFTSKVIDNYVNAIRSLGADAIAFRSIGYKLGSDYNEKHFVSRQQNLKLQEAKLESLKKNGTNIMINQGFAYAMPYADVIVDMPLRSQGIAILDEEIPFYQIALHGLIPYTGQAVNLTGDYQKNILKCAETGAGLYFVFMDETTDVLQETDYYRYFGTDYAKWKNTVDELYQRYSRDFSGTANLYITRHAYLDKSITLTEFEDQSRVIVNYSNSDYTYEGYTIPAKDYIMVREGN